MLFVSLLKIEKIIVPPEFISVYLVVHWGNIVKRYCQKQGVWKKDEEGEMAI